MDTVFVLAGLFAVPIAMGWLLARWTGLSRLLVALLAGMPLPLLFLIVVIADYVDSLNIPKGQCGFSCELGRGLAPLVAAVTVGGMIIAIVVGFVTATIVRRRRRRMS